jgi:hypothetical protein
MKELEIKLKEELRKVSFEDLKELINKHKEPFIRDIILDVMEEVNEEKYYKYLDEI